MKRNAIVLFFLSALCAGSYTTLRAQAVNIADSLALVDLYNSTNGTGWFNKANWLTGPVKTWYGIQVTGSRVTKIELHGNNLAGAIPSSIGSLINLKKLDFENNHLNGIIPLSIGSLVNLDTLNFHGNDLSGAIPYSIGNLANIVDMELYHNKLTGPIPVSIGNLTKLTTLYLSSNQLSGAIPSSIGNLPGILYITLNDNRLTGSLPPSMGNLTTLDVLYLDNNQLSGAVPGSFIHLSGLRVFDVSHNQMAQSQNINFPMAASNAMNINVSYNNNTFNGLELLANKFPNAIYAPQAHISIHQHDNLLSVSAGGTLAKNTYQWCKVDGACVSVRGDSTYQPAESGQYYARVTNKIASTQGPEFRRLTLYTDTADYTTPPAFDKSVVFDAGAVSAKINAGRLAVYPNPAKDIIYIQVNRTASIMITNAAGKRMLAKTISGSGVINVSAFANGLYYIQNTTTGEVQKIAVLH